MKLIRIVTILCWPLLLGAQQPNSFAYRMVCEAGLNNFCQTNDRGFILTTGVRDSTTGVRSANVLKLDSTGSLQWAKSFPRSHPAAMAQYIALGSALCTVHDGGYMIASTYYDYIAADIKEYAHLVRMDSAGNVLWSAFYPGKGRSTANCVRETADHGFIVCGKTRDSIVPNNESDGFLFRIDSLGNLLWGKAYAVSTYNENFLTVNQTTAGDYVISGMVEFDGFVLRTNSAGVVLWSYKCGASNALTDVQELPDGDFLTIGFNEAQNSTCVYRLNPNGTSVSSTGYRVGPRFEGFSFVQTWDGLTIATRPDAFIPAVLAHIDTSGNFAWYYTYPDANSGLAAELVRTNDGGYAFSTRHEGTSTFDWSIIVARTDSFGIADCTVGMINPLVQNISAPLANIVLMSNAPLVVFANTVTTPVFLIQDSICVITDEQDIPQPLQTIQIYPNPTSGTVTVESDFSSGERIRLRVCDVAGRTVFEDDLLSDQQEIDLSMLNAGLYFLFVEQNGAILSQKPLIRN